MKNTYILQKDLPGISAGGEFLFTGKAYAYVKNGQCAVFIEYAKGFVENNPEWFKLKEQEKPKEWEMVSYYGSSGGIWTIGSCVNDTYRGEFQNPTFWLTNKSWETFSIHSVKRLSDGLIFKAGCRYLFGSEHVRMAKVLKFKLLPDGDMVVELYPDGETNTTGSIFRNLSELCMPKEKDVFVWDEPTIKEWAKRASDKFNNPDKNSGWLGYEDELRIFKQSKISPPKIEVQDLKCIEGFMSAAASGPIGAIYSFRVTDAIPENKHEAVREAIEFLLNAK